MRNWNENPCDRAWCGRRQENDRNNRRPRQTLEEIGRLASRRRMMSQVWRSLLVNAKAVEAERITSFELVDPEGKPLTPFSAGSHIDVEIKQGLVRQYSLCNDPRDSSRYLIAVLLEPNSRGGSRALIESLDVGQMLRVSEPRNLFSLNKSAKRFLLLAAGIGVTPIICMADQLAGGAVPFNMHYYARSQSTAAFLNRIRASRYADNVTLHFSGGGTAALVSPRSSRHPRLRSTCTSVGRKDLSKIRLQ